MSLWIRKEVKTLLYEGGIMTKDENIDEEEYEAWWENVWKPTPRGAWIASRLSLREENERLREQANLWAVKAGAAQAKVEELKEENERLKGELSVSRAAHADTMKGMAGRIRELEREIDRLRGEARVRVAKQLTDQDWP